MHFYIVTRYYCTFISNMQIHMHDMLIILYTMVKNHSAYQQSHEHILRLYNYTKDDKTRLSKRYTNAKVIYIYLYYAHITYMHEDNYINIISTVTIQFADLQSTYIFTKMLSHVPFHITASYLCPAAFSW